MMKVEMKNNLFVIILVAVMSVSCKQLTATAVFGRGQRTGFYESFNEFWS